MKYKISSIVITKNEEGSLSNCLKSINWCNETIVIDDKSSDNTANLAEKLGAKVFIKSSNGNFSSLRNFALSKAKHSWVLFLDADERIDDQLKKEIQKAINTDNNISGYKIRRLDTFLGKKLVHGETANVKLLRLAKKDNGIWQRPVHEEWIIKGKVENLKATLIHHPHLTISKFLKEINYYTDIEASYRLSKGVKSSSIELYIFPIAKFIKNYFLLLGFLDGFPGFIMAYIMSLHSFLVRVKMKQ